MVVPDVNFKTRDEFLLSLQPELLDAEVSALKGLKTKAPKEVFDQKERVFKSGLILSLSKGQA